MPNRHGRGPFKPARFVPTLATILILSALGPVRALSQLPGDPGYGPSLINSAASADAARAKLANLMTLRLDQQKLSAGSSGGFSQADQFAEIASAAKAFRGRFGSDSRAGRARKLEVQFTLQARQIRKGPAEAAASALADAYITDASLPVSDRFDIALQSETYRQAATVSNERLEDNGPAYSKVADDLYARFGPIPQVFTAYLTLMRTTVSASGLGPQIGKDGAAAGGEGAQTPLCWYQYEGGKGGKSPAHGEPLHPRRERPASGR